MPYRSTKELGKGKEGLPEGAKKIFMGAFNAASEKYGEDRASAIAWAAVKKKYKKNDKGEWVAKTEDEAPTTELVDHVETLALDLNDKAELQITKDGYMVAVPRLARTGIQLYYGSELGLTDEDVNAVINVYRPEGEVFDVESLRSLAYRPVTLDHPPDMVDAKNWRRWAVGQLGGDFARDGQFIRFPMTIMDGEAVDAIKSGRKQLSVGYSSEIKWEDGVTPDGEPYDAIQTNIRANHVAVVKLARGGPKLKIGDDDDIEDMTPKEMMAKAEEMLAECKNMSGPEAEAMKKKAKALMQRASDKSKQDSIEEFPIQDEKDLRNAVRAIGRAKNRDAAIAHVKKCAKELGLNDLIPKYWSVGNPPDERSKTMPGDRDNLLRTIVVDGVSIEVPEISAQVVQRAINDREEENKTLRTQVDQRESAASQTLTDQRKLLDDKDGQIAALKRQLADLEMTPGKLDKLVRDRHEIVSRARAIMGDGYSCDGRTDVEIKRAVVSAKLGEQAAKAMSDEAISGAFSTLMTAMGKDDRGNSVELARTLGDNAKNGGIHSAADAAQVAYEERNKRMANAWRRDIKTA